MRSQLLGQTSSWVQGYVAKAVVYGKEVLCGQSFVVNMAKASGLSACTCPWHGGHHSFVHPEVFIRPATAQITGLAAVQPSIEAVRLLALTVQQCPVRLLAGVEGVTASQGDLRPASWV
jgi:hypothetical protein